VKKRSISRFCCCLSSAQKITSVFDTR